MANRSSPSELNTRTIRVNIDDWRWINSLSLSLGVSVAEVFHEIVTGQGLKEALIADRVLKRRAKELEDIEFSMGLTRA
ncbi:MAG: hypothetical protein DDT29_02521 [Dehalococcoidia bacterium]|nr:hypothetical protein [Bacillota bacterium]